MQLQKNVSLKNYTTFQIGGKAKYFTSVRSKDELIGAVLAAKKMRLPFFILGLGSNLLVSDEGFKGLVIGMRNGGYKIKNKKIEAGAGTPLSLLANAAFLNSLTGLEWAVGIPGNLGGAIFGNTGAFGQSMKNIVEKVEILDAKNMEFKVYPSGKCMFDNRDSVFKKNKNLIIVSAVLKFRSATKKKIKAKMKECLEHKIKTQPLNYPSAGSVFKNPGKKFAAKLIEGCNLKGKKSGQAEISAKHANFILNLGGARAGDVKKLINLAKKCVKDKFKVNLEEEIQYLHP